MLAPARLPGRTPAVRSFTGKFFAARKLLIQGKEKAFLTSLLYRL